MVTLLYGIVYGCIAFFIFGWFGIVYSVLFPESAYSSHPRDKETPSDCGCELRKFDETDYL